MNCNAVAFPCRVFKTYHSIYVFVIIPKCYQMLIMVLTYVVCLKSVEEEMFYFSSHAFLCLELKPRLANVHTKQVLAFPSMTKVYIASTVLELQCKSLNTNKRDTKCLNLTLF